MRRWWTVPAIALMIVVDQVLKQWAERGLAAGKVLAWEPVIALRYVRNTGAAFSMLSDHTVLLSVGTGVLLVAGLVVLLLGKVKHPLLHTAFTMILAGGCGNLIDRVRMGYVIDYIDPLFVKFAVFNFADILITVGAALMILWLILDTFREKKEKEAQS